MRDPVGAVFAALSDPNRRFVVETLASGGTTTPTELTARLPVTRQAVAKHLKALGEAGLVEMTRSGRESRYALTPDALDAAAGWIEHVGAAWDERLAALSRHLGGERQGVPVRPAGETGEHRGRPRPSSAT
jgi:DNA-binding transcriptional ArsR family regulator